jgi:hypothetical protein
MRGKPPFRRKDVQINVIHLELLQTGIQCSRNIGYILIHLGRDEQLLSRKARFCDSLAKFFLSAVDFSTIEVIISQLHGTLGRVDQVAIQSGIGLFEPCGAGAVAELVGVEGVDVSMFSEPA